MTPTKLEGRLIFLDYLRIFAFASVLIGHKFSDYLLAFSQSDQGYGIIAALATVAMPLVRDGGVGVMVFFLVSGYIITNVLQNERAPEFLIKRIFRIYPLYVAAVLSEYSLLATVGLAPDAQTLMMQLSLAGDFFNTPYALKGVEWTLRIEVVFYALMACYRAVGLMNDDMRLMPLGLIAAILGCVLIAPFPSTPGWSMGYLSIYAPYLLLGAFVRLHEIKIVSTLQLIGFGVLTLAINYGLILAHKPSALEMHFGPLACLMFFCAWKMRTHLRAGPFILWLSELTYAVYLFHHWFFDYCRIVLQRSGYNPLTTDLITLAGLLIICTLAVRLVERPGIHLGRYLVKSLLRHKSSQLKN